MPDHRPRLCAACDGPLTARRACPHCGTTAAVPGGRARSAGGAAAAARVAQRAPDPLMETIELLLPWMRGERGCWR